MKGSMNVVIDMDGLYNGDLLVSSMKEDSSVYSYSSVLDGHVVKFGFNGSAWTEEKARKWIRNKGYNKILWREHKNGKVMINSIRLSSKIMNAVAPDTAESILGKEKFAKISEIESEHGSSKPFITKVVAMEFNGEDKIIANRLEFDRKATLKMLKDFVGLSIHPGHNMSFFTDFKKPMGNTVMAFEEEGNPVVYAYLYPYGDGKEFRDGLRIADAQGLLANYSVSMAGSPTKIEPLQDDDEDSGKIYARVLEWEPSSMDFVPDPAISGSQPVSIVNSKQVEPLDKKGRKLKLMDNLSMTEIIAALSTQEVIALSDFLSIDAFKKAVDGYVKAEVDKEREKLIVDEEFKKKIINSLTDEEIKGSEKISEFVANTIDEKTKALDAVKDSIEEVAKNAKIELSKPHAWVIRNSISEPISEQELLKLIQKTVEIDDLSEVPDFFLSKEKDDDESGKKSAPGITITEVTAEEAAKHI